MADVLIRGLSPATLRRLSQDAAAAGLSRNEHIRRRLESEAGSGAGAPVTLADLDRAAAAAADLLDEDVMRAAWR
ncbi:MAG: antitoxin [Bifidobacteriaceae bacterium]|jgi:hypothetical protein|nr:antitoxin [Bifidobacteriaceae bacterium]